ncbi:MAG: hypothetical protein SGJ02_00705 [bacterium]|nr:hypothetical protein [bacterium]
MRALNATLIVVCFFNLIGCSSILKKKENPDLTIVQTIKSTMTQEEAQAMMETGTRNWAYGQGIGDTTTKVTTSIFFPPAMIYFLGNAGLNMVGYEGLYITDALPKNHSDGFMGVYDTVTSIPGRVIAAFSGTPYRSEEVIRSNGGFWGRSANNQSQMASLKNEPKNDGIQVASNHPIMRNDLYGEDRSGS